MTLPEQGGTLKNPYQHRCLVTLVPKDALKDHHFQAIRRSLKLEGRQDLPIFDPTAARMGGSKWRDAITPNVIDSDQIAIVAEFDQYPQVLSLCRFFDKRGNKRPHYFIINHEGELYHSRFQGASW